MKNKLKFFYKNTIKASFLLLLCLLSSCSLVKIESEQIPLSKRDLNTRLLTQAFVQNTTKRVEIAADSIIRNSNSTEVHKNALLWKINTLSSLKSVGYQTSPNLALMDTWVLTHSIKNFFSEENSKELFEEFYNIPIIVSEKNLAEIIRVAKVGIEKKDFEATQNFVNTFSKNHQIKDINFNHQPVRESYLEFKKIPDSLAVQTVGTLSEVVSDLTNRMSAASETTGKQIQWNSELFLKDQGIDEKSLKELRDSINLKLDRFLYIAEQSPELLDDALSELQNQINSFNSRIDENVSYTLDYLSTEREIISEMIEKERIELDSIVQRESKALAKEANVLSTKLLDNTMNHVKDLVKTALIYIIILLAVIIFLPFAIGFYVGKIVQHKKDKKSN